MKTTVQQIWTRDLDAFEKALNEQEDIDENEMRDHLRGARAKASKGANKLMNEKDIKVKKPRKKKNAETSSDDEFSDEDKPKRGRKAAPGSTEIKSARLAPRASTGDGLGVRAPTRKNMSVYVPGQPKKSPTASPERTTDTGMTSMTTSRTSSKTSMETTVPAKKPTSAAKKVVAASTRKQLTRPAAPPTEPEAAPKPKSGGDVASLLSR